jgi:hypothetical protein
VAVYGIPQLEPTDTVPPLGCASGHRDRKYIL